jgi:hypothetical protein
MAVLRLDVGRTGKAVRGDRLGMLAVRHGCLFAGTRLRRVAYSTEGYAGPGVEVVPWISFEGRGLLRPSSTNPPCEYIEELFHTLESSEQATKENDTVVLPPQKMKPACTI